MNVLRINIVKSLLSFMRRVFHCVLSDCLTSLKLNDFESIDQLKRYSFPCLGISPSYFHVVGGDP